MTFIHDINEYWFCTKCNPPHLDCHKEVGHIDHCKHDSKSQQPKLAAATSTKSYLTAGVDPKHFEEAIAKA